MLAGSPFSMVLVAANGTLFFFTCLHRSKYCKVPFVYTNKIHQYLSIILKMTSKEFDKEQLVTKRDTCNMLTHWFWLTKANPQQMNDTSETKLSRYLEVLIISQAEINKSMLNSLVPISETGRDSASFINVHYCKSNTNEYKCIVRVFSVLGNSAVVRQLLLVRKLSWMLGSHISAFVFPEY